MLSPLTYANSFIKRSLETRVPLNHMQLQKLLYLLYARYSFRSGGEPLFANNFECWPFGPVLSDVYQEFKKFGKSPISDFAYNCDRRVAIAGIKEAPLLEECFDEVWARFSLYSGVHLSRLTHKEGTAWSKANEKGSILLDLEEIRRDGEALF